MNETRRGRKAIAAEAKRRPVSVTMPPHLLAFIRGEVEGGRVSSASALIVAAVTEYQKNHIK